MRRCADSRPRPDLRRMTLQDLIGGQDLVAMFFYFMHFPLPILVGFVFWLRSRDHYHRFIAALLLMAFISFITYLFWPSAPPWWQFGADRVPSGEVVHKILNETVDKIWGKNYIVTPLYTHLNPNQFAAFPSLHAAFPMLGAVYAWNRYRWLSILLIVWSLAVIASIVYLGERDAVRLSLPDLPHDGPRQLVRIVV